MRRIHLPEEIIEDVLVRLPVRSIIRFQCVSKSWLNLITSNCFIHKHLITSEESFVARIFLLRKDQTRSQEECVIRSTNICDLQIQAVDKEPLLNFELPPRPYHCSERLEFVGHCNGIVCLKCRIFIFLVNPSLKQVKNLPIPPICDGPGFCVLVGFGFDNMAMDFKVVRMLRLKSWEGVYYGHRFEIYSLRSNAWRKLDEFPLDFADYISESRTTFLNEIIIWCVKAGHLGWRMFIFNMATELFDHLEFPQGWDKRVNETFGREEIVPNLFVLNQDSIAFASYLQRPSKFVDIWTMNKENKEETWTKLYSIGPLSAFKNPLSFSKKHRFLYKAGDGKLILYDLQNHHSCVSRLPYAAQGLEFIIELGECRSSLFSINNM